MTGAPEPATDNPHDAVPLFLERRSYRMRRVMDGVRLVPLLGLLLWMIPLLWPRPDAAGEAIALSRVVIYVFVIWLGLICASFGLWLRLRPVRPAGEDDAG